VSAPSYPDTVSADAKTTKRPNPFRNTLRSFVMATAGIAAGIVLARLGVPLWFALFVVVAAACDLVMGYRRFVRRRHREVEAVADGSAS